MLLTLTLREVERATPRAAIVRMALGGLQFDYAAGQAVLVGRSGQTDRRPYSLATSPAECRTRDELELLVGLDAVHQPGPHFGTLTPGMSVDVEGPVGSFTFPPAPVEHRFLFVAGGTGIAPLRAMLHEALARPAPTQISVIYSARTPNEFAYGPELRALAAAGRLSLWQTVTREAEEHWDGAQGRIALGHLRSMLQDTETLCFLCGPHALVREISPLLEQLGIAPERVRVEEWK